MGKVRGMRWWMIGLVTSGLIVNYIARNSLAVAAPEMNRLLSISTAQYSYIVASFQAAYMVMQPIAGYILDVVGIKIGFALFAIAWSGACMLHGAANGWISLAVFRGMLGLTEAAGIPSGLKATSEWFPAKERSIATGWFNIGSSIGAVIAPPLVVWWVLHGNWRMAFVSIGVLGLHPRRTGSAIQNGYRRPSFVARHYQAPRILGHCDSAFSGRAGMADLQFLDSALHGERASYEPEGNRDVRVAPVPRG
jgi:ACS family hexuronate transporter-like MFS transporter